MPSTFTFNDLTGETNYTVYLVGSSESPDLYRARWTDIMTVDISIPAFVVTGTTAISYGWLAVMFLYLIMVYE